MTLQLFEGSKNDGSEKSVRRIHQGECPFRGQNDISSAQRQHRKLDSTPNFIADPSPQLFSPSRVRPNELNERVGVKGVAEAAAAAATLTTAAFAIGIAAAGNAAACIAAAGNAAAAPCFFVPQERLPSPAGVGFSGLGVRCQGGHEHGARAHRGPEPGRVVVEQRIAPPVASRGVGVVRAWAAA